MNKSIYVAPNAEIIKLAASDIVATSDASPIELPVIPASLNPSDVFDLK